MIEVILVLSTMCASGMTAPCFQKQQVVRQGSNFQVISSTFATYCDGMGHTWKWVGKKEGEWAYSEVMECSVCKFERKMKKTQQTWMVVDEFDVWEDNGERVNYPDRGLVGNIFLGR